VIFLPVIAGATLLAVVVLGWRFFSRDRRSRHQQVLDRIGAELFRTQARFWTEPPVWLAVDDPATEAWHAATAQATHEGLVSAGFRHLGHLGLTVPTLGDKRGLALVVSAFADDSGTIVATSHAPETVDVVELETEFADGHVINTRNCPTRRLGDAGEVGHEALPLETPVPELLARHRDRVREAQVALACDILRFASLEDAIESQRRQWLKRSPDRVKQGLDTRADFDSALLEGFSRKTAIGSTRPSSGSATRPPRARGLSRHERR